MIQAEASEFAILGWLVLGGLVAAACLFCGIDQIDEDAEQAYVFRPLLVPAILLIWPLVLWRWRVLAAGGDQWQKRYDPPRRRHPVFAYIMPLAMALIIGTGLTIRQVWPEDFVPVQISPPEVTDQ